MLSAITTSGSNTFSRVRRKQMIECSSMQRSKIRLGFKKLLLVSVGTDVVAMAMYVFWDLDVEELWSEVGAGK